MVCRRSKFLPCMLRTSVLMQTCSHIAKIACTLKPQIGPNQNLQGASKNAGITPCTSNLQVQLLQLTPQCSLLYCQQTSSSLPITAWVLLLTPHTQKQIWYVVQLQLPFKQSSKASVPVPGLLHRLARIKMEAREGEGKATEGLTCKRTYTVKLQRKT